MPNLSESDIIAKAIAGDTYAFRLLVEKHQTFAYSLSCRFLSSQDDAADVTQEAFIRLWKNISKYRPEIKLTTWLYKIITNLCLDHLKSRHRKRFKDMVEIGDHHEIIDPSGADQLLLSEEFRILLFQMASELTPKQKAVFILRDLEELEIKEVSDILSMSAGNVKSNLYYARVKMSELIKKCYQERKREPI
jgi:RNA polymerase sigma-70 factor, ECF subfamily